jgi:FkbM family methyltransferase
MMAINTARHVFERLRQFSRSRRIHRHLPDPQWRSAWERASVELGCMRVLPSGNLSIELATGALELPKTAAGLEIAAGAGILRQLAALPATSVQWDHGGGELVLRHRASTFRINGFEELYIAGEILLEGAYNLLCIEDCLLFDVGANVGFASVHLASSNPSLLIEAFEPIQANCARARRNLESNPALGDRVRLHPFGLYSEAGTRSMQSAPDRRGMSSLVIDRGASHEQPVEVIDVTLRRASEVVASTIGEHPGRRMLMKMDCEGSEYAILGELMGAGLLARFDLLLLEWHRLTPGGEEVDGLFASLREHGFHIHLPGRRDAAQSAGLALCSNARAPARAAREGR